MSTARVLACLGILALAPLAPAQNPPTAYTITEISGAGGNPSKMTVYRNGSKAAILVEFPAQSANTPASRTLSLYDLKQGTSWSWDPTASPATCDAGTFSGDWGDPFAMSAELTPKIASGEFKPGGLETLHGIPTTIYESNSAQGDIKVWFDQKDSLVIRAQFGSPGSLQTLVDIQSVSVGPPMPSVLALPASCAGVKPPPSAADLIATETGDSGANFVNANYGPGSKDSCSVMLRVVAAGTMAPIARKFQVAIDTTYNQDNPPHYESGVHNDGSETFSGGGIRELTSSVSNATVSLGNPPPYFMLEVNVLQPGHGGGMGLIYRQCFAPVTMLYYVVKDPNDPGQGGDFLWAKSGKYAAVPRQ